MGGLGDDGLLGAGGMARNGDLGVVSAPADSASGMLGPYPPSTGPFFSNTTNTAHVLPFDTSNYSQYNASSFGYGYGYGFGTTTLPAALPLSFPLSFPEFDPILWQNLWDPFFINDAASGLPVQQDRTAAELDPEMVREIDEESSKWWTYCAFTFFYFWLPQCVKGGRGLGYGGYGGYSGLSGNE